MDWNNGDQRHKKRRRQACLYDKAGPISPRRKDEHQYARIRKGEIALPNRKGRLLPLRVNNRTRDGVSEVCFPHPLSPADWPEVMAGMGHGPALLPATRKARFGSDSV